MLVLDGECTDVGSPLLSYNRFFRPMKKNSPEPSFLYSPLELYNILHHEDQPQIVQLHVSLYDVPRFDCLSQLRGTQGSSHGSCRFPCNPVETILNSQETIRTLHQIPFFPVD
ncbi:hypothetical protein KP509_09G022200 [Ceratopteris richardii]|uniref:Uncharacterized protein n=1 Tax=Ceratopteris richardii TaxID=49495 RepID=A0A8T2U580_CERRI|nr:hypothetical protein KP509_09G022200 [Ceratopteris richardii]